MDPPADFAGQNLETSAWSDLCHFIWEGKKITKEKNVSPWCLLSGPDRDRTDDLYTASENAQNISLGMRGKNEALELRCTTGCTKNQDLMVSVNFDPEGAELRFERQVDSVRLNLHHLREIVARLGRSALKTDYG